MMAMAMMAAYLPSAMVWRRAIRTSCHVRSAVEVTNRYRQTLRGQWILPHDVGSFDEFVIEKANEGLSLIYMVACAGLIVAALT